MARPVAAGTTATIPATAADIIAAVSARVPPPSAPVPELVMARLPPVIPEHTMKKYTADDHLVHLQVSGTLTDVLEGPMPHRTWVARLQTDLEKAQTSGRTVTAIRHPTQVGLTLPLWALSVWDSMAVAAQERMAWVEATEWLRPGNHRPDDHHLVEEARRLIARFPWGLKGWPLYGNDSESQVGFLAKFISTRWLAERNIDIMGICCNAVTVANGGPMTAYMAPVHLGAQLQFIDGWDAERIRTHRDLGSWKDEAKKYGYRYIHIPINFGNNHWVVVVIDIEEQTYLWGMLLAPDCMDALC